MTSEQAYIEGFVKRASEYGLDTNQVIELLKRSSFEEEYRQKLIDDLSKQKANVPLQTLFGGGFPGAAYNVYRDVNSPKETPNRTARILGGNTVGSVLGGALGGLGGAALSTIGENAGWENFEDPALNAFMPTIGAIGGSIGGSLLGSGLGAHSYNKKLKEIEDQERQKLQMVQALRQTEE